MTADGLSRSRALLRGIIVFPFLILVCAVVLPVNAVGFLVMARRERKFSQRMKALGRTVDFASIRQDLENGRGTLMLETFSFEGPTRAWWTEDDISALCPYPIADWFSMLHRPGFEDVRHWLAETYTARTGKALLVLGSREEWSSVRGTSPTSFKEGIRALQIAPGNRQRDIA